ncbi:MAG: YegP family protein [Thermoleophilaceae bacterium]
MSASGGYRAQIRGGNHEIMFWTEVYTTKASAQHAIDVVKASAYNASVYDQTGS